MFCETRPVECNCKNGCNKVKQTESEKLTSKQKRVKEREQARN